MKKLLSIEYAKLKKLNSLRIILLVYAIMIPLVMFMLSSFYYNVIHPLIPILTDIWGFPTIWNFATYSASFFNVLMGVTVVIVVCNEYSYRTMKQNVIDGLSKREVILSKFLVVFALSTIVTLYTALVAFVFGGINSGFTNALEDSYFILIYYLQTLGYFSFAFFFAVLVKRTALSIIFFIVSFIVESIIGSVITATLSAKIYLFFPLNVFSTLTPSPIMKQLNALAAKQTGEVPPALELSTNIAISLGYMALFFVIAYQVLKRRDL